MWRERVFGLGVPKGEIIVGPRERALGGIIPKGEAADDVAVEKARDLASHRVDVDLPAVDNDGMSHLLGCLECCQRFGRRNSRGAWVIMKFRAVHALEGHREDQGPLRRKLKPGEAGRSHMSAE